MKPPFVLGLVGGIGAGKSAAAEHLAKRGALVIDADRLGHEVLGEPAVRDALTARWGNGILRDDGSIDRGAVAGIVFPNPAERTALEAVMFPAIARRTRERIAESTAAVVVLDAAVLLEAGWRRECNRVLYIDAPRELRQRRVAARSGWGEAELAAREASQWSEAAKKAASDAAIVNDGSREELAARLDAVLTAWGLLDGHSVEVRHVGK